MRKAASYRIQDHVFTSVMNNYARELGILSGRKGCKLLRGGHQERDDSCSLHQTSVAAVRGAKTKLDNQDASKATGRSPERKSLHYFDRNLETLETGAFLRGRSAKIRRRRKGKEQIY